MAAEPKFNAFGQSCILAGPGPQISAEARMREIAELLAAGLTRLQARKSSGFCASGGESSLHFSPAESGHPTRSERENWG
jgi:hypothetical protein